MLVRLDKVEEILREKNYGGTINRVRRLVDQTPYGIKLG